jgi:hypothetical protein
LIHLTIIIQTVFNLSRILWRFIGKCPEGWLTRIGVLRDETWKFVKGKEFERTGFWALMRFGVRDWLEDSGFLIYLKIRFGIKGLG